MGPKVGATVALEDHRAKAVPCGVRVDREPTGSRGSQWDDSSGVGGQRGWGDIVPEVPIGAPCLGAF